VQGVVVRLQRQKHLFVIKQQAQPVWPVVKQLAGQDVLWRQTKRGCYFGQQFGVRQTALQRRRGKRQAGLVAADAHQPLTTFLHDELGRLDLPTRL